ncbi:hypothetical protein [Rubrivirga sp.]|uniref:hypothetical protein n=1 Tax=Rubrivirga sp. TaxID=1885344 RepID=UPI003B519EB6
MRIACLFTLLLAVGCGTDPDDPAADPTAETADLPPVAEAPDDLAALGSEYVETPLQNAAVDVHHVRLPAGASLAAHRGGDRVVYALDAYTLRFDTDGETEDRSFARGDVHAHAAGVHSVENTGDTEADFLVFERRDGVLPASAAEGDTPAPTPGEGTTDEVVFDGELAEVHRVTLQPGAQLPPHRGYARAIYSLSGYTVEFSGPDGTREQRFEPGQAHYHDPGDHTVENAGDTVAEFLVVEFKR